MKKVFETRTMSIDSLNGGKWGCEGIYHIDSKHFEKYNNMIKQNDHYRDLLGKGEIDQATYNAWKYNNSIDIKKDEAYLNLNQVEQVYNFGYGLGLRDGKRIDFYKGAAILTAGAALGTLIGIMAVKYANKKKIEEKKD